MIHPIVLGTAGHIDHGKTSLVRALTGIDTDRLPVEKARGITTELGFARLDLGERRIAVVDVPGHERFVKSMVAGATGLDLVCLVIAADEGVMPQTREHLDICDLLGVRRGLVVLTKRDLVDDDWLAMVTTDVTEALAGTFLAGAPIVPVSAKTNAGLDELRAAIATVVDELPPRATTGVFRLPVDRVFTVKGFGTIVTGTVLGGELAVGDELHVLPGRLAVRVRGLEVHGAAVEKARAGHRAAINLGGIAVDELARGDVLAHPERVAPSHILDVELRYLRSAPAALPARSKVLVHHGTAQVLASLVLVRPIRDDDEGDLSTGDIPTGSDSSEPVEAAGADTTSTVARRSGTSAARHSARSNPTDSRSRAGAASIGATRSGTGDSRSSVRKKSASAPHSSALPSDETRSSRSAPTGGGFAAFAKAVLDDPKRAVAEVGSTDAPPRIELAPGEHAIAQLRIDATTPLAALPGDHFIVRGFSKAKAQGSTIGGGSIIRVLAPKARARVGATHAETVSTLATARVDQRIAVETRSAAFAGLSIGQLVQRLGVPAEALATSLATLASAGDLMLTGEGDHAHYLHARAIAELEGKIAAALVAAPDGVLREELRTQLPAALPSRAYDAVLAGLEARGLAIASGDRVQRANTPSRPSLSAVEHKLAEQLAAWKLEPPRPKDMPAAVALTEPQVTAALAKLVAAKLAVRVKPDYYVHAIPIGELRVKLLAFLDQHKTIDAQQWKDLTGASRKFTIPLAEYFDAEKVTLRIGDVRRKR